MIDLSSVRQILVIKLRYIGDVLLSTPVVANLRHHFPESRITMVVNKGTEEVLRHNPHLNEVLHLDRSQIKGGLLARIRSALDYVRQIRGGGFDLVVDLTDGDRGAILSFLSGAPIRLGYNAEKKMRGWLYTMVVSPVISPSRPRLHNVEYQLEAIRALGLKVETDHLVLRWGEEEDRFAEQWLTARGLMERPFIVAHPGARWWFKQWPLERFAALSEKLFERYGLETVFLGGEKEKEALEEVRRHSSRPVIAAEGLTLLQVAALVKRAGLFIGNDNGPMHIAAAVGTPVIALFGSSDPKVWGPWGKSHRVLYKEVPCSPCAHTGCDMGDLNCMRLIQINEVMEQIERLWQRREDVVRSPLARP